MNVTIVAACIPTLQPLLSRSETTRRIKGYRRSGFSEERNELGNLSRAYAVKRNGTASHPRYIQSPNCDSIQRNIDVDIYMGAI